MRPRIPGNGSEYINRNNKVAIFMHLYIYVIFYPKNTKFAVEVPTHDGRLHSKFGVNHASHFWDTRDQSFSFFLFFFSHKHKNRSNSETRASIGLKFGKRVKANNISTKFCEDPTKILADLKFDFSLLSTGWLDSSRTVF